MTNAVVHDIFTKTIESDLLSRGFERRSDSDVLMWDKLLPTGNIFSVYVQCDQRRYDKSKGSKAVIRFALYADQENMKEVLQEEFRLPLRVRLLNQNLSWENSFFDRSTLTENWLSFQTITRLQEMVSILRPHLLSSIEKQQKRYARKHYPHQAQLIHPTVYDPMLMLALRRFITENSSDLYAYAKEARSMRTSIEDKKHGKLRATIDCELKQVHDKEVIQLIASTKISKKLLFIEVEDRPMMVARIALSEKGEIDLKNIEFLGS